MKNVILYFLVLVAFTTIPAFAESGHDHEGHDHHGHDHEMMLDEAQITEKASGYVAKLVDKGKLASSWIGISPSYVKENDAHEWVVTFSNPSIEAPEKQKLYMFLSLSGKYIAANFTGR